MDLTILYILIAKCCFLTIFQCSIRIWEKSEKLKIQDGGRWWRHLYGCGCHGNQLDTTWFRLIESTKKYQIKYEVNRMNGVKSGGEGSDWPSPPPVMPSCNFFNLKPSMVKQTKLLVVWSWNASEWLLVKVSLLRELFVLEENKRHLFPRKLWTS